MAIKKIVKSEETKFETAKKAGAVIGKILKISFTLAFLLFAGIIFLGIFSLVFMEDIEEAGNVALIKIIGPIMSEKTGGAFGVSGTSSSDIVKLLKKAEKNSGVNAVILEINSPGGSAVASAEIANAVKNLNKTTVSVIREVGASGAYWIASATDRIFANELSMTGSIGVIGSYVEYAGLMERYNLTYQRLVSGKYKDAGTPLRKLKDDEKDLIQALLDKTYDAFVREVAANRNLDEKKVRELATGFVYLGSEAKEAGLIDEFGGREEAIRYIEEKEGSKAEVGEYKPRATFSDLVSSIYFDRGYAVGRGIGDSIIAQGGLSVKT